MGFKGLGLFGGIDLKPDSLATHTADIRSNAEVLRSEAPDPDELASCCMIRRHEERKQSLSAAVSLGFLSIGFTVCRFRSLLMEAYRAYLSKGS